VFSAASSLSRRAAEVVGEAAGGGAVGGLLLLGPVMISPRTRRSRITGRLELVYDHRMTTWDAEIARNALRAARGAEVQTYGPPAPTPTQAAQATAEPGIEPEAAATEETARPKPEHVWEMTYDELRSTLNPTTAEDLQEARPILAEIFADRLADEEERAADPWGIIRAVERGDEMPRVPVADLSIRHRQAIREAMQRGEEVPAHVLAEYPDLQPSGPTWSLPDELDLMTAAEITESIGELQWILTNRLDPETREPLSDAQVETGEAILRTLIDIEGQRHAEEDEQRAYEGELESAQHEALAQLEEEAVQAPEPPGAVERAAQPPDRGEPTGRQPGTLPEPITLEPVNWTAQEGLVQSWIDYTGGDLLESANERIALENDTASGTRPGVGDTEGFAVHPDALTRFTPAEQMRIRSVIQVTEDDSYAREMVGDAMIDAILEEAAGGERAKHRNARQRILDQPELAEPEQYLAAFLIEARLTAEEDHVTADMSREESARARRQYSTREREWYDPSELPVGATFQVEGIEFEIVPNEYGELMLTSWEGLNANIIAESIARIPIDRGTLQLTEISREALAEETARDDAEAGRAEAAIDEMRAEEPTRTVTVTQPGLIGEEFGGPVTGAQETLITEPEPSPVDRADRERRAQVQAALDADESGDLLDWIETKADQYAADAAARLRKGPPRGLHATVLGESIVIPMIADATIYLTAKAMKYGVRGARGIRNMVRAWLERRPHLRKYEKRIARNVQKLITASVDPETGKIDPARFELAATDLRNSVERRVAYAKRQTAKGRIREALRGPKQPKTITESEALHLSLAAQRRAAHAADRARGDLARTQLIELRRDLQRQHRDDKAGRQLIRKQLTQIVRELLPVSQRGKLLTNIRDAETPGRLAKSIRKVHEVLQAYEHNVAVKRLDRVLRAAGKAKLRPEYQAMIDELTGDVMRKALSGKRRDALQAIADFLVENPDSVIPIALRRELARLSLKPIAELTTEEAEQMADMVEHFLALNHMVNRVIRGAERRQLDQLAATAAAEVLETRGGVRPIDITGTIQRVTRLSPLAIPLSRTAELKPDTFADFLSGGDDTLLHQIFYGDLNQGHRSRLGRYHHAIDVLHAAVQEAGFVLGSRTLARMSRTLAGQHNRFQAIYHKFFNRSGPAVQRGMTRAETRTIELSGERTLRVTSDELMGIVATLRDSRTRDLIEFEGTHIRLPGWATGVTIELTHSDIETIMDQLTDQEHVIVTRLMEYNNTIHKRAIAQWAAHQLGYDITFPENHWPRHRVRTREPKAGIDSGNYVGRAVRELNIAHERTEERKLAIEIQGIFAEFNNLSWYVASLSELEPAMTTAQRALAHPHLRAALSNTYGGAAIRYFEAHLNEMARESLGGQIRQGPFSSVINPLLDRVAPAFLGLNPRVALYQVGSLIAARSEISEPYLIRALLTSALSPGVTQRMRTYSPMVRDRLEQSAIRLMSETLGKSPKFLGFRPSGEWMMAMIRAMDTVAIRVIWRAAELKISHDHGAALQGDAYYAAVAALAEKTINRTQPVFDTINLAGMAIEARGSAGVRGLTLLHAPRNANVNNAYRAAMNMRRDPSPRNVALQSWNIAATMIGTSMFITAAYELFGALLGKDYDDEWYERWSKRMIDATAGNLYLGDVASWIAQKATGLEQHSYGLELSPATGLVEELMQSSFKLRDAITADSWSTTAFWDAMLDLAEAIGQYKGVGFVPAVRMARELVKNRQLMEKAGIIEDEPAADAGLPN